MSETKPAILSTRTLHEGFSTFRLAQVRLEDGAEVEREIEDHGNAVAVLPYDPERRTALLVRVLRPPALFVGADDPHLLEAPAGILEDESPEAAARREAEEEAGVRLGELEPFGAPFSTAGVSTERLHLYLAPYLARDRTGEGGGLEEEHENIKVREVPLAQLWADVEAGRQRDLKTIALCALLKARRPELFET
jgi:nudix-type nucleoside diphosphatase (YffH/AdpP family)